MDDGEPGLASGGHRLDARGAARPRRRGIGLATGLGTPAPFHGRGRGPRRGTGRGVRVGGRPSASLREAARVAESAARADVSRSRASLEGDGNRAGAHRGRGRGTSAGLTLLDAGKDEQAGAPFYELVDFLPDLESAARAGLEAALEASGLLDAWVAANGLVVHPSTHDVILRLDAPVLPEGTPTLADVLTAVRPEVARLLRAVGLGDSADSPWMATDGRWSLGPLRGAWSKAEAEYLGAGARRATRDRRLADDSPLCGTLGRPWRGSAPDSTWPGGSTNSWTAYGDPARRHTCAPVGLDGRGARRCRVGCSRPRRGGPSGSPTSAHRGSTGSERARPHGKPRQLARHHGWARHRSEGGHRHGP